MQRDFSKEVAIFKAANSLATEAPGNGWQWVAMGGNGWAVHDPFAKEQPKTDETCEYN